MTRALRKRSGPHKREFLKETASAAKTEQAAGEKKPKQVVEAWPGLQRGKPPFQLGFWECYGLWCVRVLLVRVWFQGSIGCFKFFWDAGVGFRD